MSISIRQVAYTHADNETLFHNIHFTINKGDKTALIGINGSGKSTLLRIIAGLINPTEGEIIYHEKPYYVPQHFGQYDDKTVAEALLIDHKLKALHAILSGDADSENFTSLDDDWTIEERSLQALQKWGLSHVSLIQPMATLSGGEKTKVFLAGLQIHSPAIILLDEPTNHLDTDSRQQLYDFILSSRSTLLIVSHDITLLNLLSTIYELEKNGIKIYGGNYDFYKEQKKLQTEAIEASLEEKEKELRLTKKIARETAERKQKHEARGKKLNLQKGVGKMAMNIYKDRAEKSRTKLNDIHQDKASEIQENIKQIRKKLPEEHLLKINFDNSALHLGKILVKAENIIFSYHENQTLFLQPYSFIIRSGDRYRIIGKNGSGKTTLLKLITGELTPNEGKLEKADFSVIYIDQEYSLIDNDLTVYEQAQQYNTRHFEDHEIKTVLNRFLFTYDSWDKPCTKLSGGEKMRLAFCCLMIGNQTPDMIILDEPTNNLDIQSIEIITNVIKKYQGTLIVVSHDNWFTHEIGINKDINIHQ